MKWAAAIALALALTYGGLKAWTHWVTNPRVVDTLRAEPHGERAARTMLLHFPDGGTLPVNYLREGERVFAGADGRWWRAFRDGGVPVTMEIRGERFAGRARVVLDDAVYRDDVFTRLRPKVPEWLPDWLDAHLVVIDIEG